MDISGVYLELMSYDSISFDIMKTVRNVLMRGISNATVSDDIYTARFLKDIYKKFPMYQKFIPIELVTYIAKLEIVDYASHGKSLSKVRSNKIKELVNKFLEKGKENGQKGF